MYHNHLFLLHKCLLQQDRNLTVHMKNEHITNSLRVQKIYMYVVCWWSTNWTCPTSKMPHWHSGSRECVDTHCLHRRATLPCVDSGLARPQGNAMIPQWCKKKKKEFFKKCSAWYDNIHTYSIIIMITHRLDWRGHGTVSQQYEWVCTLQDIVYVRV